MLTHHDIKTRQRAIRDSFPSNLGLRVHRAISWIGRAEAAAGDDDATFVFYWIAFNAAYADEAALSSLSGERSMFESYFQRIVALDGGKRVYRAIWDQFKSSIRVLLDNPYVFQPFWSHQNGVPGNEDWEARFEKSRRRVHQALVHQDTQLVLTTLFDRLYVLRNQIVHGGATWNSSINRDQLRDGARILAFLVPLFVDLMMDNPHTDWGAPHYPVVD